MIQDTLSKVVYTADGLQRQWYIPFQFNDKEDLHIYLTEDGVRVEEIVQNFEIIENGEIKKIDNPDVEVIPAGNYVVYPTEESGLAPLEAGKQILILRETPNTQLEDASEIYFKSKDIERGLDKLTMQVQELARDSYRAVKVSHFDTTSPEDFTEMLFEASAKAEEAAARAATSESNAALSEQNAASSKLSAEQASASAAASAELAQNASDTSLQNAERAEQAAAGSAASAVSSAESASLAQDLLNQVGESIYSKPEIDAKISGLQAEIDNVESYIPLGTNSNNTLINKQQLLDEEMDIREDLNEGLSEIQTQLTAQAAAIANKQEKLVAGSNITIDGNIISATGGGGGGTGVDVEPATEEKAGIISISTSEEAREGFDDTTAMTPLKTAQAIYDNVGRAIQLGFDGTLSGNILTFEPDTDTAYELKTGYNYTIDLLFPAVVADGTLDENISMVINNNGESIKIVNALNDDVDTDITVGNMKQIMKYTTDIGFRWIFNASLANTASGIKAFVMPSTVVNMPAGGGSADLPDNVYTKDNLIAGENVAFEQTESKINGEVQGSLNITSGFVASGFSDDNVIVANDPINEASSLQSFEICTSFKLYSTTNCGIIDTAGSAGNARWRITLQDGVVRARTMFYASTEADVDIYGTTYVQPGVKYKLKYAYIADTNNGMYGYRLWVLPEGEDFRPDNIQGFHPYVERPYVSTTHNTIRLGDNSAGGNAMDGELYLKETCINVNDERAWEAVTIGGKTKVSVTGAYTEDNLVAGENVTITEVLPEGGIDEHTLACWHFDEDLVDEKNNLSLVGSGFEISAEASKFGNSSAKMNSSGDYATVVSDVFADLFTKDFTIDFWLRREEFYVGNTLFGFSDKENAYDVRSFPFNFALGSAGSSTNSDIFQINNTKIGSSGFSDVKVFGHIAIVFSRENSTCSLYLNGSKLGEYVFSTLPTNTKNLSFYFPGSGTTMRLDEFRVSDCIRWTKDFTPPTEPYTLATGPSKKAINAVIPPVELPSDLYKQSNLLGGKNIEIIPEPVEGGIDEYTLSCFHLDGTAVDEVTGYTLYPTMDNSVHKFGTGSSMWTNSTSFPWSLNSYESFSFDYWYYHRTSRSSYLGLKKAGYYSYLLGLYFQSGATKPTFRVLSDVHDIDVDFEQNKWTHVYVYYNAGDRSFHLFVNGKEVFSSIDSTDFSGVKEFSNDGYTESRFDEIRISKCIRWTEDFEPPTQPYRKAEPTGNYVINYVKPVGEVEALKTDFSNYSGFPHTIDPQKIDGVLHLQTNKIYRLGLEGHTVLSLPTMPDETTSSNQILIKAYVNSGASLDWGTYNFYNKSVPTLEEETYYDLVFDYDQGQLAWVAAAIPSGRTDI